MYTAKQPTSPTVFTHRENEILSLIATGLGSKQIADQLGISTNTVSTHRKNMLSKTGARNSVELVHIYITIIPELALPENG